MSKVDFKVQTHEEYIQQLSGLIKSGLAADVIIMTMNLYLKPGSLYYKFARTMLEAKKLQSGNFEIRYDKNYANRTAVLSDGHYVLMYSFWDPQNWLKKIAPHKVVKKNQEEFAKILVDSPSRFFDIPTSSNWLKRRLSRHLLQGHAANHAKSAVINLKNGEQWASLLNGELVSDVEQNNLVLTIKNNPKASQFVEKATNPNAEIGSRGWTEEEIFPKGRLVVDYGNYGEPGQLSRIHDLVEVMLSPLHNTKSEGGELQKSRPKRVIMITQYAPTGRILEALRRASLPKKQGGYGARVVVPLEPDGNYRRIDPGFQIMVNNFMKHKGSNVLSPILKYPTHVKCLLARYDDGTASMIFGTDNFDSLSDSFYRNTELNLYIDRVKKGEDGYKIIVSMLKKLAEIGDISTEEAEKFLD